MTNCKELHTTSAKVSEHLFAFMIEYSMLSIGFCYDVFKNIGTKPAMFPHGKLLTEDVSLHENTCCYKFQYGSGLISGILMVAASVGACVLFGLHRDERITFEPLSEGNYLFLFYGASIIMSFVSLFLTIHALRSLMKLYYLPEVEFFFDEGLLVISLGGTYFLIALSLTAAFYEMKKAKYQLFFIFYIVDGILTYFQLTLQYLLIRNGIHRRAVLKKHFKHQPGRAAICFLMLTNFAQWVALSFMIVAMKGSVILIKFYGTTTWVVASNMLMPMDIFHRFHAGACLAEIFETSYKLPLKKTN